MAAIGELFKNLGKNEIFANYCNEITNEKTNNEIINLALNDENLMSILKNIINNEEIIKNKMDIIIGQKRKTLEKLNNKKIIEVKNIIVEKNKDNEYDEHDEHDNNEHDEHENEDDEIEEDKFINFKYKPLNIDNVVWLDTNNYLERVSYQVRLVNINFELYY
jgi:ABC-type Zn2+ transport system substrate-binding protein/surface adhesin